MAFDELYAENSSGTYEEGFDSYYYSAVTGKPISDDEIKELDVLVLSKMSREKLLWQCNDRSYQSKRKGHMMVHIESKHVETTGFLCPYCNFIYKDRISLKNHINRTKCHKTLSAH